ncbi:Thymidylate synthase [Fusarium oxysporum f. sp. albedinis]|nr:Thymidylate synthase [Fusarium oxysporum f. sp. albedinis]
MIVDAAHRANQPSKTNYSVEKMTQSTQKSARFVADLRLMRRSPWPKSTQYTINVFTLAIMLSEKYINYRLHCPIEVKDEAENTVVFKLQ